MWSYFQQFVVNARSRSGKKDHISISNCIPKCQQKRCVSDSDSDSDAVWALPYDIFDLYAEERNVLWSAIFYILSWNFPNLLILMCYIAYSPFSRKPTCLWKKINILIFDWPNSSSFFFSKFWKPVIAFRHSLGISINFTSFHAKKWLNLESRRAILVDPCFASKSPEHDVTLMLVPANLW